MDRFSDNNNGRTFSVKNSDPGGLSEITKNSGASTNESYPSWKMSSLNNTTAPTPLSTNTSNLPLYYQPIENEPAGNNYNKNNFEYSDGPKSYNLFPYNPLSYKTSPPALLDAPAYHSLKLQNPPQLSYKSQNQSSPQLSINNKIKDSIKNKQEGFKIGSSSPIFMQLDFNTTLLFIFIIVLFFIFILLQQREIKRLQKIIKRCVKENNRFGEKIAVGKGEEEEVNDD